MTQVNELPEAILGQIDADLGVQDSGRTVRHDDGTTEAFRVDIIRIAESHFTATSARHRGEGPTRESGPREFARADRQGLAAWLANEPRARFADGSPPENPPTICLPRASR